MTQMRDDGRERVVAIIGGGNGIGAATARLLHQRNWRVAIADIDEAGAAAVASECSGFGIGVDVLEFRSLVDAAERIETRFGPIFGLVNAAAIFQPRQPPESLSIEDWDRIVDSGYRGTYIGIVEFAKRMATRGGGSIVNISSMVGQRPNHGHGYSSAKAAVNALTESMAVEWGRSGVRVNAVSPGYVAVPRMIKSIQEGKRYAVDPAQLSALGRLVEPVEVATSIAFLLSDDASAVTGANLVVDAGALVTNGWFANGGPPPARAAHKHGAQG